MSGTITCFVTMYRLHLNSSDYRDSYYVKWFEASLCVDVTISRRPNPCPILPFTSIQNYVWVFTVSYVNTHKFAPNPVSVSTV